MTEGSVDKPAFWTGSCGKRTFASRDVACWHSRTMHNKFRIYYHPMCSGYHVTNSEAGNVSLEKRKGAWDRNQEKKKENRWRRAGDKFSWPVPEDRGDPLHWRCPNCWALPGKGCRRRFMHGTYTDPCRDRLDLADEIKRRDSMKKELK